MRPAQLRPIWNCAPYGHAPARGLGRPPREAAHVKIGNPQKRGMSQRVAQGDFPRRPLCNPFGCRQLRLGAPSVRKPAQRCARCGRCTRCGMHALRDASPRRTSAGRPLGGVRGERGRLGPPCEPRWTFLEPAEPVAEVQAGGPPQSPYRLLFCSGSSPRDDPLVF